MDCGAQPGRSWWRSAAGGDAWHKAAFPAAPAAPTAIFAVFRVPIARSPDPWGPARCTRPAATSRRARRGTAAPLPRPQSTSLRADAPFSASHARASAEGFHPSSRDPARDRRHVDINLAASFACACARARDSKLDWDQHATPSRAGLSRRTGRHEGCHIGTSAEDDGDARRRGTFSEGVGQ